MLLALPVLPLLLVVLVWQLAAARGVDTDFYPRWYGLRQLLLAGRDPYSADISREIAAVTAFFGGKVSEAGDATTLEAVFGFLYPLPGTLVIAPLALLPYQVALAIWLVLLLLAIPTIAGLSTILALTPRGTPWGGTLAVTARVGLLAVPLSLFFLPSVVNLLHAQFAPVVVGFIALAAWLFRRGVMVMAREGSEARRASAAGTWDRLSGHQTTHNGSTLVAGALLACAALIKPQLVALLTLLWVSRAMLDAVRGDPPARVRSRRFILGGAVAGATLTATAFTLLPGWLPEFIEAASQYRLVAPMTPISPAMYRLVEGVVPDALARALAAMVTLLALGWAIAGWRGTPERAIQTGLFRTTLASALVIPPAWETNAIQLLIPLGMTLGGLAERPRAAVLFVAVSIGASLLDLPLAFLLIWRNGAALILLTCAVVAFGQWLARTSRGSPGGANRR